MTTPKFWPLDMDPEGQIYDNPAWDLPGFRRRHSPAQKKSTGRPASRNRPVSVFEYIFPPGPSKLAQDSRNPYIANLHRDAVGLSENKPLPNGGRIAKVVSRF
jgi:hypothetical protein